MPNLICRCPVMKLRQTQKNIKEIMSLCYSSTTESSDWGVYFSLWPIHRASAWTSQFKLIQNKPLLGGNKSCSDRFQFKEESHIQHLQVLDCQEVKTQMYSSQFFTTEDPPVLFCFLKLNWKQQETWFPLWFKVGDSCLLNSPALPLGDYIFC